MLPAHFSELDLARLALSTQLRDLSEELRTAVAEPDGPAGDGTPSGTGSALAGRILQLVNSSEIPALQDTLVAYLRARETPWLWIGAHTGMSEEKAQERAHETTANQLGMCFLLLQRDRELMERLRTRPELLPAAVSELLRFTSLNAVGGVPHMVQEPVTLGGTLLEPGQVVLPVTDGANRDPDVFPEPDALRLDRPTNPHVSFGHGRHRCLGAPLAQMELEVALGALLLVPSLGLAVPEEQLQWRTGMYIRGVRRLPVTW
jgi:hypothetical protein